MELPRAAAHMKPRESTQEDVPPPSMQCLASLMPFRRDQTIYVSHDSALHWYRIVAGAARQCALLADGRRQIVEFLLPGDFFGFNCGDRYGFNVEAVADGTVVARYPRARIELLVDSDPQVARQLRECAFDAISRLQTRMLILGRMTAVEKVGAFLLEMSDRSNAGADRAVVLPMSRYDIADYLALAVETVSRAITDLKNRGAITLACGRCIRIVAPAALAEAGGPARERRKQERDAAAISAGAATTEGTSTDRQ